MILIRRVPKINTRYKLLLISFCSLMIGIFCYILFRESDLLVNRIFNIQFVNIRALDNFIFINFIRYNLPDGLWLFSGCLILRSIWNKNNKMSQIYVIAFILFAFLFEIGQYFNITPGTFDIIDLFTMGIFALFEQFIYKYYFLKE